MICISKDRVRVRGGQVGLIGLQPTWRTHQRRIASSSRLLGSLGFVPYLLGEALFFLFGGFSFFGAAGGGGGEGAF